MESEQQQIPIQVQDLHKSFGAQTVLDGIALEVREGQTLVVLGRSGGGKSVLLKLLIGLQAPDSGSVRIRGKEIIGLDTGELNEIRKSMGFLFQQAALYDSLTLEENVIFPMSRHTREPRSQQKQHARELLASVGIKQGLDKLPSQISGGMQKRVGLARALALNPEILLFDEPTAGLDPITSEEIENLIIELKKSRRMTAVVVTHDIRAARAIADCAILVHEGKIAAQGTFAELQKSEDPVVSRFLRDGS
jgi:phospholipid/cholesterol/gamma-HCH transport system ATP-binding protein